MLRTTAVLAVLCGLPALPAAAQGCQSVTLPANFTTGDIKGTAPADGMVCYDIKLPRGQNISIEVASGRNIIFTGPGWDARSDRIFVGDLPGRLKISVGQLMRAAQPEPFAIRLRFEDAGNG
ncbi:hypothetical protein [Paracoccus homiensis]|uniref:Uncharacterized protein n=1 Tax=Paracoccus homiensis TaxID=364199 RepID=A0A1I0ALH2_9RHOB|nr:hypothetical protein [Paracoccus homiensis]SES95214.1 hypothetical protein SAMN04489858_102287 [Paracoccus homiensis]